MGDYYFKLYKSQTPIIEQAIEAACDVSSAVLRGIPKFIIKFRSCSGEDKEDNLITLCTNCHSSIHI